MQSEKKSKARTPSGQQLTSSVGDIRNFFAELGLKSSEGVNSAQKSAKTKRAPTQPSRNLSESAINFNPAFSLTSALSSNTPNNTPVVRQENNLAPRRNMSSQNSDCNSNDNTSYDTFERDLNGMLVQWINKTDQTPAQTDSLNTSRDECVSDYNKGIKMLLQRQTSSQLADQYSDPLYKEDEFETSSTSSNEDMDENTDPHMETATITEKEEFQQEVPKAIDLTTVVKMFQDIKKQISGINKTINQKISFLGK